LSPHSPSLLLLYCPVHLRDLHSFPTRRSSDLSPRSSCSAPGPLRPGAVPSAARRETRSRTGGRRTAHESRASSRCCACRRAASSPAPQLVEKPGGGLVLDQRHAHHATAPPFHVLRADDGVGRVVGAFHQDVGLQTPDQLEWRVFV